MPAIVEARESAWLLAHSCQRQGRRPVERFCPFFKITREGQQRHPLRKRQEGLQREQARLENHVERLVTAYQEGLITLAQLRQRMPDLQQRTQAAASELQSLEMAAVDQTRYLQLAETLSGFRTKLCARADTLDIKERQQIVRLLVKEILVGADALTLRHSIPIPPSDSGSNGSSLTDSGPSGPCNPPSYRLRSRSSFAMLKRAAIALDIGTKTTTFSVVREVLL